MVSSGISRFRCLILPVIAGLLAAHSTAAPQEPVSFRNDVMAVISKAGCNLGTCHGNANGKAGFKLSLRGEDPEGDYAALTHDMFARRTDPLNPDTSLILLKATTQIAHEGGSRFRKESPEYQLLRGWIAGGLTNDLATAPKLVSLVVSPTEAILIQPTNQVQITARAEFSDGKRRDVGSLAVYEPSNPAIKVSADGIVTSEKPGEGTVVVRFLDQQVPVRLAFVPERPNFVWQAPKANNFVDGHVFGKLRSLQMNPSELCSDNEFVRRAYLDVLGILPTGDEARKFVRDTRKDKRAQLVDELLDRPEYADFWALKWADVLRNEEKVLDRKGVQLFHRWIRQNVAENKPLDEFVRELLSARGSTYQNPAGNYFRALRDPVTRAESTAQVFLGTRLGCAKCHNHPFDRWSQADYYDWAQVFSPVNYKVLENKRRDGLDKHEFVGEQIIWARSSKNVTNPRTGKPAVARYLGETAPTESDLAEWITRQPLFARAQANRIWYHLMGRGIVDPIDDFRPTNPPSIPGLLDALANELVREKFNVKHLIRVIMTSRTYQLSPVPNDTNADDAANFSRAIVRRLSAEQLLDAQSAVAGVPLEFAGYPKGMRAAQIPGVRAVRTRGRAARQLSEEDKFLTAFGKPQRLLTCECERSDETSMGQAFQLISGPAINDLLTASDNRVAKALTAKQQVPTIIDELYWTALSRPPTETEFRKSVEFVERAPDKRQALEDVTWALLNAKEFVLRK